MAKTRVRNAMAANTEQKAVLNYFPRLATHRNFSSVVLRKYKSEGILAGIGIHSRTSYSHLGSFLK